MITLPHGSVAYDGASPSKQEMALSRVVPVVPVQGESV